MAYYGFGDSDPNSFDPNRGTYRWLSQSARDAWTKSMQNKTYGFSGLGNNGYAALGNSQNSIKFKDLMARMPGMDRASVLRAIGMNPEWGVTDDTSLIFSDARTGGGDVTGSLANTLPDFSQFKDTGDWQREGVSGVDAIVDDNLKGFVQLGNMGPLNDDIENMLTKVFDQYGVQNNPEAQEQIKNTLFKFDPRFGVLGNSDFINAAVERNNNRKQGFFEGPVGQMLATVAANFVGGPAASAAVSAGFAKANGGSWGDALKAAAGSYIGSQVGAGVTGGLEGSLGSLGSKFVGHTIGDVVNQGIAKGKVNVKDALLAGGGGTLGGMAGDFVGKSLQNYGAGSLLQKLGSAGSSNIVSQLVRNGGKINTDSLIAALLATGTAHGIGELGGGKGLQKLGSGFVGSAYRANAKRQSQLKALAQLRARQTKTRGIPTK